MKFSIISIFFSVVAMVVSVVSVGALASTQTEGYEAYLAYETMNSKNEKQIWRHCVTMEEDSVSQDCTETRERTDGNQTCQLHIREYQLAEVTPKKEKGTGKNSYMAERQFLYQYTCVKK